VERKEGDFSSGYQNISIRIAKKAFSAGPSQIYAQNMAEY